jgi:hypothetical protein
MRASSRSAAAALLCLACGACGIGCGDEVTATAVSPDGRLTAESYVRNCGATTPYATHVVVRPSGSSVASWFGRRPNAEHLVYVVAARPAVGIKWLDSSHLTVRISGEAGRVFCQKERWRYVSISYVR